MRKNMKLTRIFQNISIAVIITALGLTSCDYLDVVPPEQPNIDDAMSSPTRALGFLYSCYGGVSTDLPSAYLGEINSTTDEYVLPYSWNTDVIGAPMHLTLHHPLTKTGYGELLTNI